jgi:hypothetical protein
MRSNQFLFRQEVEEYWRDRLKSARQKYELAVAQQHKALEQQKRWPLPAPDGSGAVRSALIQESAARNEYMRILKIFTDLTIYGKVPEED